MFKKRENLKSTSRDIPARFVKRDGVVTDAVGLNYVESQSHSYQGGRNAGRYINEISANEISESYISSKHSSRNSAPNSAKGTRKKFAPSFLLRRKKNQPGNKHDYENIDIDEEDVTDIAYYEDLVSEQESINPVMLGQLDDSQLNTIEQEPFEELYKGRLEFVLNNYRKPPPYPGKKPTNTATTNQLQNSADTPLLRQLLKDKNLNDNASMNNFWQASPGQKMQNNMYLDKKSVSNDKLVSRTRDIITRPPVLNAGDLFQQRQQYYFESIKNMTDAAENHKADSVSEMYPAKDYDADTKRISASASVPNLSAQAEYQDLPNVNPKVYMELGEMEALIAHYRKTSLDNLEPYDMHSSASESVSLYSQGPSYIPPSPYMNAEIPEWLQVYAKASSELDKFLKWGMFRYPELDCWQTMLKRLYKKEVKQVVLWFEEYRLALQKELEDRKVALGLQPPVVFKKTEV